MTIGIAPHIRDLEKELGFALPRAYREHLLRYGRKSPIVGTDCAPGDVVANNEGLPELLEENWVEHDLPEKLVCFMMHQGYIAAWFDAAGTHDPRCWFFSEGTTPRPVRKEKFSAFMGTLIKEWGRPRR